MMGAIQVLPSAGSASTTTATASASSVSPNAKITLTANVVGRCDREPPRRRALSNSSSTG